MNFLTADETEITQAFLRDGYIMQDAEDRQALDELRHLVGPHEPATTDLNALKLEVMRRLNTADWTREAYYRLVASLLHTLVGNELAMQRKFNLNIQVPGDGANLLPIHADSWTGDSPFQVVVWVPLVDCYRTKSMWLLPPAAYKDFRYEGSSEEMFRQIEPRIRYLHINYGQVLVFNSTLPHGNRLNEEDSTRWTLNCRFKGLYTPYASKSLGEHFEPITMRAMSRVGLTYRYPEAP